MKTNQLIIGLFAACSMLLAGCSKGANVTLEDATEVALDDSNNLPENVSDLDARKEGKDYIVSFKVDSGSYRYTINKDGIIEDCDYEKTDAAQQPEQQTPEQQPAQDHEETPEGIITKEDAANAALNNAGLTDGDVSNLEVKLNKAKTEYKVEFDFGDTRNQVTVDAVSGNVLSSIFI